MIQRGSVNVLAMIVSNTIAVTANGIWIMFMPYYFEQVLGSTELVGLFFSLVALTTAIFYPVGGFLADRIGRRYLVMAGRLIAVLGPLSLLFVLLLNYRGYLLVIGSIVGYLIVFIGGGIRLPAASMLLMESSTKKKKSRNYMIAERVVPSIPPAVTVFIGATLYVVGEIELMLFLGALGLAISAIALLPLEDISTHEIAEDMETIKKRSIRPEPVLLLLIFAFTLDGVSSNALSWYVPLFLGESNALLYGSMISISTLVIAIFSLASGFLVDRFGIQGALIPGWIALSITVSLFGFNTSPMFSIILYCVWVALDTVDTAVPPLFISNTYPKEERATRMGIFSMIVRSSMFLGPMLAAFLVTIAPQLPFLMKAVMNIFAVLCIFAIPSKSEDNLEPVVTFK